ncbi:MAG: hypothetical protein CSA70_00790 [Rhodobacterales bacterium]|nr:MAG: hypothetical protein CSA70_00790 [Rhodobacterales bacterium]
MRQILSAIKITLFVLVAMLLHYVLPQHDVVRMTSTEVIRTDFSRLNRIFYAQADSGANELPSRDLRLINSEKKNTFLLGFWPRESTKVMVYRNEDTGWIWPPYFKFDSSDLQAQASANMSTADTERWVVITHYGWRNKYLSIYPNAIGIKPVDGPDVTVIPWFNIFFFVFLLFAWVFLRAMWRQFRERSIDPMLEDVNEQWDAVGQDIDERRGRIRRWLDTWRRK